MTPHAHFISIVKALNRHGKERKPLALSAYVQSEAFLQGMCAISPAERRTVLDLYTKAHARCAPPMPTPAPGEKRTRWDAENIAKFQKAHAKGGLLWAMQVMGLNQNSARLAERRFVRFTTLDRQKAAA